MTYKENAKANSFLINFNKMLKKNKNYTIVFHVSKIKMFFLGAYFLKGL